ncbi:hypothetical protein ACFFIX_19720 [Metabacillus herbersteinensis]|uniref:FbpB family small basic protein n=1 Tax=Metabacillus herbersteinensis TaxID=283816 RepID=A0ABV6GKG2_9BACI
MFTSVRKRKRIKLFSNRSRLREINKSIEKATYELDVASVEELMEERARFIDSLFN